MSIAEDQMSAKYEKAHEQAIIGEKRKVFLSWAKTELFQTPVEKRIENN